MVTQSGNSASCAACLRKLHVSERVCVTFFLITAKDETDDSSSRHSSSFEIVRIHGPIPSFNTAGSSNNTTASISKEISMSHGKIARTGNMVRFSTPFGSSTLAPQPSLQDSSSFAYFFLLLTRAALTHLYCTTRKCHLPLSLQFQWTRWAHFLPTSSSLHLNGFSSDSTAKKPLNSFATAFRSQSQRTLPVLLTTAFSSSWISQLKFSASCSINAFLSPASAH